jgi:hypothetical protein
MGHYARVPTITNSQGTVDDVIVADESFIQSGLAGDPLLWIKTSYNTRGGIYYIPNTNTPDPDQSKALRANYAGIGYTYDTANDVFYAPRPSNQTGVFYSWTIGAPTWIWQPPIPYPTDGQEYYWDEQTQTWVLITP